MIFFHKDFKSKKNLGGGGGWGKGGGGRVRKGGGLIDGQMKNRPKVAQVGGITMH